MGNNAASLRIVARCRLRTPSVRNFSAIRVRSASVGTITSTREQHADTSTDNIVSVFPMPVGITIVAAVSDTDQCACTACRAPICGWRSPLISRSWSSSTYENAPRHESSTALCAMALPSCGWRSHSAADRSTCSRMSPSSARSTRVYTAGIRSPFVFGGMIRMLPVSSDAWNNQPRKRSRLKPLRGPRAFRRV